MRVVFSYHCLHEVMSSLYNQHYKDSRIPTKAITYGHHNWPGINSNYNIQSFLKYRTNTDLNEHVSVQHYQAWSEDFSVSIFNVHQEGDLATNFICQTIPGANKMCQQLTDSSN